MKLLWFSLRKSHKLKKIWNWDLKDLKYNCTTPFKPYLCIFKLLNYEEYSYPTSKNLVWNLINSSNERRSWREISHLSTNQRAARCQIRHLAANQRGVKCEIRHLTSNQREAWCQIRHLQQPIRVENWKGGVRNIILDIFLLKPIPTNEIHSFCVIVVKGDQL